jgi:ATP-dependent Clp protease ATP-binding subunit ClpB
VVKRMLAENSISIEFEDSAINFITEVGFDPMFGARPIKRAIQKYIVNELSKQILSGAVSADDSIVVSYKDDAIAFVNRNR